MRDPQSGAGDRRLHRLTDGHRADNRVRAHRAGFAGVGDDAAAGGVGDLLGGFVEAIETDVVGADFVALAVGHRLVGRRRTGAAIRPFRRAGAAGQQQRTA